MGDALGRDRPATIDKRPALVAVKFVHTAIWLFFVACILGAPIAAGLGKPMEVDPRWFARASIAAAA